MTLAKMTSTKCSLKTLSETSPLSYCGVGWGLELLNLPEYTKIFPPSH